LKNFLDILGGKGKNLAIVVEDQRKGEIFQDCQKDKGNRDLTAEFGAQKKGEAFGTHCWGVHRGTHGSLIPEKRAVGGDPLATRRGKGSPQPHGVTGEKEISRLEQLEVSRLWVSSINGDITLEKGHRHAATKCNLGRASHRSREGSIRKKASGKGIGNGGSRRGEDSRRNPVRVKGSRKISMKGLSKLLSDQGNKARQESKRQESRTISDTNIGGRSGEEAALSASSF